MKRILKSIMAVMVALSLVLACCSCDNKNQTQKKQTDNVAQSSKDAPKNYESKKFNLKFTPPEKYVMFNDSEMAAQGSYSENIKYEMISEHKDGFPHVMVISEKPAKKTDADTYLEGMKATFREDTSGDYNIGETGDVEIAGQKYRCFTVSANGTINEKFCAREVDDVMLCIAVITMEGGTGDEEVLKAFSKLD